jgi:hypothetical protein
MSSGHPITVSVLMVAPLFQRCGDESTTIFTAGLIKVVLSVNGFAADGNMFVKRVKQKLEARLPCTLIYRLSECFI